MTALLCARALHKSFGLTEALRGVDLSIEEGEGASTVWATGSAAACAAPRSASCASSASS